MDSRLRWNQFILMGEASLGIYDTFLLRSSLPRNRFWSLFSSVISNWLFGSNNFALHCLSWLQLGYLSHNLEAFGFCIDRLPTWSLRYIMAYKHKIHAYFHKSFSHLKVIHKLFQFRIHQCHHKIFHLEWSHNDIYIRTSPEYWCNRHWNHNHGYRYCIRQYQHIHGWSIQNQRDKYIRNFLQCSCKWFRLLHMNCP